MFPVLCGGKVTAVGTLGGVRTGKGSGWIVTMEKRKKLFLNCQQKKSPQTFSVILYFKCQELNIQHVF